MRYVTVPEPVTLVDNDGKPRREFVPDAPPPKEGEVLATREVGPISLHRFLMLFIINDEWVPEKPGERAKPKIGVGYDGDKRIAKLDRLFSVAPGTVVPVEDEDWKVVKKIIEEKLWTPKVIGGQLFPISEAWMEATEKKPMLKSVDGVEIG